MPGQLVPHSSQHASAAGARGDSFGDDASRKCSGFSLHAQPPCPSAEAPDRDAAHTIACHPEQGWSLLCNGVVLFEDTGELLPDGGIVPPHRPTYASAA